MSTRTSPRKTKKQGGGTKGGKTSGEHPVEDILTKLERKRTNNESKNLKPDETFVLFIGDEGVGKTTLIQQFLGKEVKTKPTVALDYCYARRPKPGTIGSETVHLWEVGGRFCAKEMIDVPLKRHLGRDFTLVIVVDLSRPENVVPSLKRHINTVRSLIESENGAYTSSDKRDPTSLANIKPHEMNVDSFPFPFMIVANKYDLFRDEESAKRKTLSQAIRFFAHVNNAFLVYASSKDKIARDNYKTVSRQRLFSTAHTLKKERKSGKARVTSINNDEPIVIFPGEDSMDKIFSSLPVGFSRRDPFMHGNEKAIDLWIEACESLFGKVTITSTVDESSETKEQHSEAAVDEARAEADRRLEKYRKEVARKQEALKTSLSPQRNAMPVK